MIYDDIEPYRGVKPNMNSLFINAIPERDMAVLDSFDSELATLLKEMNSSSTNTKNKSTAKNLQTFASTYLDIKYEGESTVSSAKAESQALSTSQKAKMAVAMSVRQVSKIYEGLGGFLPRSVLGSIVQSQNKTNRERLKDDDYIYYADVIDAAFSNDETDDVVKRSIFNQRYFDTIDESPASGNTLAHDVNIFHGMDTNPFLQEKDKKAFQNDPLYSAMNTQSMSPRSILQKLDPNYWNNMEKIVNRIQNMDVTDYLNKEEVSQSPYLSGDDGDLNWENAPDPFSDNDIDTFDIKANYNAVLMSQVWERFNSEEVFAFVNRSWESSTRLSDVLREMIGFSKDLPITEDMMLFQDEGTGGLGEGTESLFDSADAAKEKDAASYDRLDEWWTEIGQHLDLDTLLTFGALAASVPATFAMMDWGNWADETEAAQNSKVLFRDKMVLGYLDYVNSEYIYNKFQGDRRIEFRDILNDNEEESTNFWNALVEGGYMSEGGVITDKFDPSDPTFDFGIKASDDQINRAREAMREAFFGSFSFAAQDGTLVNGVPRKNMSILGTDGVYRTLPDIIDLYVNGDTTEDRFSNAHTAYDYFMSIHNAMTGLGVEEGVSKGELNYTTNEDGTVSVKVSEAASWEEWQIDPETGDGSWVQVEGEPLTITFDSLEEAQAFKDNIRYNIAILEPLIATFAPKGVDQLPVEVLVDNAGSSDALSMITEGSENYYMGVDRIFTPHYFMSESFSGLSKALNGKVQKKMNTHVMNVMSTNKMLRREHGRKVEEYAQKKEEHEDEEIRKLRLRIKKYKERMNEEAIERKRERELKEKEKAEENKRKKQEQNAVKKKTK